MTIKFKNKAYIERTEKIAAEIRRIREALKLSYRQYAKQIETTHPLIYWYEHADKQPRMATIDKIIEHAKKNGIDTDWSKFI